MYERMVKKIYPVILSGGSGTRLWPLSRSDYPKQFLKLLSDQPMIVDTMQRVDREDFMPATLICHYDHRFILQQIQQEYDLNFRHVILEPIAKNTAAAINIAAIDISANDPGAIILVLACDHFIGDMPAFYSAINQAMTTAEQGYITCFAIKPNMPHTGYGYMRLGNKIAPSLHNIDEFIEKPNMTQAKELIKDKNIAWNSGMFMMQAKTAITQIQQYCPEIYQYSVQAFDKKHQDLNFFVLSKDDYNKLDNISFDVAVMEKTQYASAVHCDIAWNDVGSWSHLWQEKQQSLPNDDCGNYAQGSFLQHDSHNNIIMADDDHIIAVGGVDNMIIVAHDRHILVIPRDHEDYAGILAKHANQQHDERLQQYRPWGYYRGLTEGNGFLVKHITIYSGGRLSLQYHQHRAEHWVVVKGTAHVTKGNEKFILNANESTYIECGQTHRLENFDDEALELIEIQTGDILSEDDIVRLDDVYKR